MNSLASYKDDNLAANCGTFVSGSVMGGTCFLASYSCGKIASFVLTSEGKRPGNFTKMLFPMLLACGIAIFGLCISYKVNSEFIAYKPTTR